MSPLTHRLFNPYSPDRAAVVATEETGLGDRKYLIRVGRGPSFALLHHSDTYGPYDEDELEAPVQQLLNQLYAEGYWPSGMHAQVQALQARQPHTRALAALRLGWRGDRLAVEPLLNALGRAVDDVCSIIDALGMLGDERAIDALREQAKRKLLSRRRSAVEALRNLGDEEGLAEARALALDRLPQNVRDTLQIINENDASDATAGQLVQAVLAANAQQQGLALDTLYELATPACVRAVRLILQQIRFDRPHFWRYVKSVWKRSMLRLDHVTFAQLNHAIERQGRHSLGTAAVVKSGYDGQQRSMPIFQEKTVHYVRRACWRHLRTLARWRPAAYPYAAAEAIAAYDEKDAEKAHNLLPAYSGCWVLNQVLYGASKRLRFDSRRVRVRYANYRAAAAPLKGGEERFPELWQAEPRAYLRVLGKAKLTEAHQFALRALQPQRMREAVVYTADHEEILALLGAPYEPTVQLGLEELDRRFDPNDPDWPLIARVVGDDRDMVKEVARRWVRLTANLWVRDGDRVVDFLQRSKGDLRDLLVELARHALATEPELRQQVAIRVLTALREPEEPAGVHEGLAALARTTLLDELDALLTLDELIVMTFSGSPSARSVAAQLLGRRPNAAGSLGLEKIVSMAGNELVAIRRAAVQLLRASLENLREDPSVLFALAESEWDDVRTAATAMLRDDIGYETLGVDGIVGLFDSNRPDVQKVGCELILKHFADMPADELMDRLTQHPHPDMRSFVLDLVIQHLPTGAQQLRRLRAFFRMGLLSLWPSRKVKRQVLELLISRGLQDREQAEAVLPVLEEAVRMQGRSDFERALEGLVRLKMTYPDLESRARIREGVLA